MGCGYKGSVFCRNNGWIMENMDKGLTVLKCVLLVWLKIPQTPQNLFAQFVCPSPKVLDFNEKRLHWTFVVRGSTFGSAFGSCELSQSLFTLKKCNMQWYNGNSSLCCKQGYSNFIKVQGIFLNELKYCIFLKDVHYIFFCKLKSAS